MAGNLSNGQQAVLLNAAADQLKGIFVGHPLWELERILGNGSYGITVLLKDRGAMKFGQAKTKIRKPKRVVLKRPIYRRAESRLSAYRSKSREGIRETLKNLFAPFRNPPSNILTILGRYQGPAILLEYIENGSLLSLQTKLWEKRITLPNRLVWRFYFCLVRGVCGMVFEQEEHKRVNLSC
ncbi:hypothetical protein F4679DRAFT_587206 [Xylaria curta]|nr:hypothetical protein F4679DRAFT_587206 [Xylaria curta]